MSAFEPGQPWSHDYGDITTWIAYPEEMMQRASHLVQINEGTFVIEPVDHPQLDLVCDLSVADGVIVLMSRHSRDSLTIADRHDLPIYVPEGVSSVRKKLDTDVESLESLVDHHNLRLIDVVIRRGWEEVALYLPESSTLIVPESLGTVPYFRAPGESIGVHPFIRLIPPRRAFAGVKPTRLFVGHGRPLLDVEPGMVDHTLAMARRQLPRAWLRSLWAFIR